MKVIALTAAVALAAPLVAGSAIPTSVPRIEKRVFPTGSAAVASFLSTADPAYISKLFSEAANGNSDFISHAQSFTSANADAYSSYLSSHSIDGSAASAILGGIATDAPVSGSASATDSAASSAATETGASASSATDSAASASATDGASSAASSATDGASSAASSATDGASSAASSATDGASSAASSAASAASSAAASATDSSNGAAPIMNIFNAGGALTVGSVIAALFAL